MAFTGPNRQSRVVIGGGRREPCLRPADGPWFFVLILAIALGGCRGASGPEQHEALLGTVEGIQPDTAQITLRVAESRGPWSEPTRVTCLLTNDAEVYVNDRYAGLAGVRIGDTVELIGYRDPNPRTERFIVCLARIARNEPAPPMPDLTPPASRPTSQPQE